MRAVAAIPSLGLLVGSAIGLNWPASPRWLLLLVMLALAAGATFAFRVGRPVVLGGAVAAAFACGAALLAADAWARAWRPSLRIAFEAAARAERAEAARRGRHLPMDDAATMRIRGVLREDAAVGEGGTSLSVAVTDIVSAVNDRSNTAAPVRPVTGGVVLTVGGGLALERVGEWRRGRQIEASAVLRRPSRYLNPGVPDQERALARRGTILVGTVKSAALVDVLARGSPVAEMAASVRAHVRTAVNAAVGRWSARSAAIVTAILIGDRSGLGKDVQRRLQDAGTYHVIAISGGNVAILAAMTLAAFRLAGMLGQVAMICAAAGMGAYGFIVSGGASVDRATLMAIVYFAGRALDLRGPPLNTLALVGGFLLLADPLAVADPSFLLTFGATTAILLVVASPPPVHRLLAPAAAILTATAAAEAMLMPVAAAFFARVTFAGLLLNLVAMPLMAIVQVAGMIVLPLAGISATAASWVGWLAHAGAEGLILSAAVVDWAPGLASRVAVPSAAVVASYYAGLAAAWSAWRWRTRFGSDRLQRPVHLIGRTGLTTWAIAASWIVFGPGEGFTQMGDGRLHIAFLDVGQGDAALVRFPRGSSIVIDAGGIGAASSFDIGDRVVAPALRQLGVRRLGGLVLTHGDADHIGGAPALLRDFRPWDIWDGVPVPRFQPMRVLREEAVDRRIRWTTVQRADAVAIDGVTIHVHHPGPPDWERQEVRNDDSIVIELRWRDVSVVFTGDIGREVEREILPRFAASPLRVVKVAHHGSLTSSAPEFVRALAPDIAVASAGRSNNFGHPAPAVLARYEEVGARVFRTDQDGAVFVDTDGRSLEVRTFTGRMQTWRSSGSSQEGDRGSDD